MDVLMWMIFVLPEHVTCCSWPVGGAFRRRWHEVGLLVLWSQIRELLSFLDRSSEPCRRTRVSFNVSIFEIVFWDEIVVLVRWCIYFNTCDNPFGTLELSSFNLFFLQFEYCKIVCMILKLFYFYGKSM